MQPIKNQIVAKIYRFGDVTLDLLNFRLSKNDEPRRITPRAFEVLVFLVENTGRVVGKQEIFDNVWGESFVTDNALTRMIKEIRQVLGDDAESPTYIETVPKRGYRFLMPVEVLESVSAGPSDRPVVYQRVSVEEEIVEIDDDEAQPAVKAISPVPALPARTGRSRNYGWFLVPVAALVLLAAVGAAAYFYLKKINVRPPLVSENISLQRLTNTDNLYWAMLSPNGQFVAYVLLSSDGRQSLHLLDINSRSERMVVPPDNVSFYGGGFKPDSSELYYDTFPRNASGARSTLYQIPVLGDTPRKIKDGVSGPISFTPDGRRFVFDRHETTSGATQLVTANSADGGDETVIGEGKYNVDFRAPNFSPDGSTVLFVAGEKRDDGWYWQVDEVPSSGGERRTIVEPTKQRLWGATWLGKEGDILVLAQANDTKNNQLFTVARGSGKMTRLTNDLNAYSGLSATADGTKIVVTQDLRMNDVWVWDRNTSEKPRKITNRSVIIHSCTFTPSGRVIYNIFDNGKDILWSSDTATANNTATQLTSPDVEGDFPDVSPDGRLIVYLSNRSGSWQIWRMNTDGTDARQLTSDSELPVRARFALGGKKIVYERNVDDRAVLSLIDTNGGPPEDFSLPYVDDWSTSADGRAVAYEFYDQGSGKYKTAVQSLEERSRISYLDVIPKDFLAISPDGHSVFTKRNETENDPISTIWEFPVDGSQPRKFVTNSPDNIYWAEFSDDGARLALVQGRVISNLILFTRSDK